jgi:hypothetical protein
MTGSARGKKSRSKKAAKKKADYLDNTKLALRIMSPKEGFSKVKKEIGDRLDPIRATRILKLLKDEYGYKDRDIPKELRELAAMKKKGHTGGPVIPPVDGEEREYTTGKNTRIGVPLGILGKKPGAKTRVKFTKEKIEIFRK